MKTALLPGQAVGERGKAMAPPRRGDCKMAAGAVKLHFGSCGGVLLGQTRL